jgi:drug/metabolite transporter (DMT)-like permease
VSQAASGTATARWLPGFLVLSVIWGSSFALIKAGVHAGVPPTWVALWRCLLGALTLWGVCLIQRARVPGDWAAWGHAMVVAFLVNAAPFTLLAYGETHVSSVLAGVLNAATPLTTLLFALALVPQERATARRLAGLLLGFAGVLIIVQAWHSPGRSELAGVLACLAATICYGAGFAYTRRSFSGRSASTAALTAIQLTCATALLIPLAPAASGPPAWPGAGAAAALLALGALGTGAAFLLNLRVIRAVGPARASTVTYLIPLWSALIGTLALSEPLSWSIVAGGLVVLVAVLLAQSGGRLNQAPGVPLKADRS